jgi:putative sterol carrier protein
VSEAAADAAREEGGSLSEGQVAEGEIDFSSVDPEEVASLISSVSDKQLREALSSPQREAIIAEVFSRMERHFKPHVAQGVDAVIHWKVRGRPDGGADHYEVVVRDGSCITTDQPQQDPRVTLALDGVHFMRLVTGNASGPMLFMTRKLKIDGDLMFATRIQSMFAIPATKGAAQTG